MSRFPSSELIQQAIDRKLLTVTPEISVASAIALMNQHQSSYIAIVEMEKLVGIFTERDVVRFIAQTIDLSTLCIQQVMSTQLVTLTETESQDICVVMSRLRSAKIRHLPIIDPNGKLLGILTPYGLRQALSPTDLLQIRYVGELMVKHVLTATPQESLLAVSQQMAQHRKSCIVICSPVTANAPTQPIGILTERDILRCQVQGLDFTATSVAEVMSTPLLPLKADASLWEAHQMMQQHYIRRLVVTDETGILVGIVTQSTLLEAIDPVDLNAKIELLEHVIADKTQALRNANTQMQQEMAQRLEAETQVRQLNAELEARVRERTAQLEASNQELQNTLTRLQAAQDELIQAEKMAALGQLIASIAHEINTPLSAIRSSASTLNVFLTQVLQEFPRFCQELNSEQYADFVALIDSSKPGINLLSSREKRQVKRQLIEQLEAKGFVNVDRFADTIVDLGLEHDIEAWLLILNGVELEPIMNVAYRLLSMKKSIDIISIATDKGNQVVSALKQYIYPKQVQKTPTNIVEGIETVLTLYNHQLKQGVEIIRNYESSLPKIFCYPDELQQVWMNLIQNALHAIDNQGTITIQVGHKEKFIFVSFSDSGVGIPQNLKNRIFDIFFTTKPLGKGSGMGLYLVRKIIDKHQGQIQIESIPGNTRFTISLPL